MLLSSCGPLGCLLLLKVLESLLPHLLPTIIADSVAQGEHGIDIFALPMHSCPFETGLDDILVGTLHHAGTNWPTVASELRVLHQRFSFAQVLQMLLDSFLLGKIASQAISHA